MRWILLDEVAGGDRRAPSEDFEIAFVNVFEEVLDSFLDVLDLVVGQAQLESSPPNTGAVVFIDGFAG